MSVHPTESKAKIAIIFYSMYGHIKTLAQSIKEGVEAAGAEAVLLQVPETLPAEVLEKMHAPPKDASIPVATVADLENYDGIIVGIPTRYGGVCAQVKAFWDATGGLWQAGKLVNKTGGVFVSTATQGGGQETTALTFIPHFVHHGMIYVPLGYTNPALFDNSTVHGGGPWGPGTITNGDGSRMPSESELAVAKSYGTRFAGVTASVAHK